MFIIFHFSKDFLKFLSPEMGMLKRQIDFKSLYLLEYIKHVSHFFKIIIWIRIFFKFNDVLYDSKNATPKILISP